MKTILINCSPKKRFCASAYFLSLQRLFVGGAKSNPLLASFASLLALLLWLNLSTQVILLASSFIVVSEQQEHDRVASRYGVETLADYTRQLAEEDVRTATAALREAQP